MKILQLHENSIEASLINGDHRHFIVIISRTKLNPSGANVPFTLSRIHVPVRPSYAINKVQRKIVYKVWIYLHQPFIIQDQLYVVFTRGRTLIINHIGRIMYKIQGQYW